MRDPYGWAGAAGVLIPALGQALVPIWTFPGSQDGGADILAFVHDHHGALTTQMVANLVGVTLWLVFGCGVWRRLGPSGDRGLSACLLAGVAGMVTLLLGGFVAFDLLVYREPQPALARLLYDLTFGMLAVSGLPTAVALGAYAVAVRRRRQLPQPTVVLAGLAAAAHVLLLLSFVAPRGFFALEGLGIAVIPGLLFAWILVTGLAMVRRPVAVPTP